MRLVPIGLTAAAAVAGGVVFLAATGANAGATHDDADALAQIASAQSALAAAADDLTAPPPTVTVTATTTATPPTVTATATATATVTAAPQSAAEPRVASVYQNAGESWADACVRTMSYGFTGCVRYLPAGTAISWDAQLQSLAAQVGTKPIDLMLTAKTYSDAGLKNVADNLPGPWKAGFLFNIYQEPEDNLTDAASQAAYRANYTAAAKVLTAAGLSKPWVEWQEWTTDPANTKGWDLADFTPPAGDFGGVLWSLFEYNEKDRVDAQVARIVAAMAKYAPGKPWALMAGAYTLEPADGPFTSAQLNAQAAWLTKMHSLTDSNGSVGWAWFNYNFSGSGGAAGESRVEVNPAALSALRAFPGGS